MQKVRILMVDDHPENLLALEAVLSSPNYDLVKAHSGEEALKRVLMEDFAMILLDVQMPGLNGFETARLIKAREKSKDIPILFVTAISQAVEHVIQGYSVGGIDYIFKPFEPETLIKKVEGFVKIYQTATALRKAEALARAMSEVSVDTILTLDPRGQILSANPALQEMFDYSPAEVIGQNVAELLPKLVENLNQWFSSRHKASPERKRSLLLETIGLRKNGRPFPVELSLGEAFVDEQQVYICTIRDITERKQIEKERRDQFDRLEKLVMERTIQIRLAHEKLRLSEKRFRQTFASSPNLMSIRSLKDGRYLDVNESWEKHTEYRYEEVRNRQINLFHYIEDSSKENEVLSFIHEQPVRNIKVIYKTKSGQNREGLLSTEILELDGEKCLLTVITDITERMILEQEIARLDRLHLIGEMAAGIAHEIRNPMTTVRGFLQMMSNRTQHKDHQEFFELMIGELDRANSIITEFLTLSKNETLQLTRKNLNKLIKTLFPLIQADAFNSRKDVKCELQEIPDLEIDEREIRQMILNLARNGLEAMPPDGTLFLRTYPKGDQVILEVKDQGPGIAPDVLQKLGTPFFTTKEMGTGLGLAVCYGIAEKHQAKISIDTSSQGTTFYISFPIEKRSQFAALSDGT